MPKFKCSECHKVFYGWAIKYKLKYKCPDCGGEIRQIANTKKYRKVEGYDKEDPEIQISKLLKLDI